ncbi:MAG: DMT family transporter [Thiothrix sp.]|nr:DMT family transporter [Thiothrix sp.]HPE60750.1 DMT family transporter [Thiolinea sp.]
MSPSLLVLYTILALLAFAGNSVLCRLALGGGHIDAAGFTLVRLGSGIVVLALLVLWHQRGRHPPVGGSWLAALYLFAYAAAFSWAYLSLDTGTGALILFAAVQLSMIGVSLWSGLRPGRLEWLGLLVALCGFVYLVLPGLNTPSWGGFLLMTLAGVAWGAYTLRGRGSRNALNDTAWNFFRTLPLLAVLLLVGWPRLQADSTGLLLAVVSGGVTSGLGYALWYAALPGLGATQAAVLQLLVPVISALGGVLFAAEQLSARLILASVLVLGGILLVLRGR